MNEPHEYFFDFVVRSPREILQCAPRLAAGVMSTTFAQRWLRPEVYPIFAAIGGAVGLCGFFCTRQLVASPGFTAAKSRRMAGILEEKADFEEGKNWRDHRVRRFLRSMYGGKGHGPQIFPGLNESFGGGQH